VKSQSLQGSDFMSDIEKKISFLIEHFIQTESLDSFSFQIPKLQAHRGLHDENITENSLAAFRNAKKNGLTMSECDIHLSSDKIPIVYHDEDMRRLHLDERKIKDVTAKELWQKHQIPTLEMLLCDKPSTPFLNIEIKSNQIADADIPRRISEVIHKTSSHDRVIVSSFNPFYVWHMQNLLPEVPRALIATRQKEDKNNFFLRIKSLAPFLKIHFLNLNHQDFSFTELRKLSKKHNICLWTVNEAEKIDQYLSLGIRSVISDTCKV